MFALTETEVRLLDVNPRAEMHGDEPVPAADLKLQVRLSNDKLAMFEPDLKRFFYKRDDDKPELFDDTEHLTKRRFPQIPPVKWEAAVIGAKVLFQVGISGKEDIHLDPVDVNEFRLDPQEGGTVVVTFRVQGHPDEKQFGKLCMLAGHDLALTITPPQTDQMEERAAA